MPFGKFEGDRLDVIYVADKGYLRWAVGKMNGAPGDAIEEFMEEHDE